MRLTARSPACATPGPSTRCFRCSPPRGSRAKKKGEFTREELAPLAKVNVESLKEYDFFTDAQGGRQARSNSSNRRPATISTFDPKETTADAAFRAAAQDAAEGQGLEIEVYDKAYFVDFSLAEKEPAKLVGAPAQCKLSVGKPQEMGAALAEQLSRLGPNRRDPSLTIGARVRQQDHGEMPVSAAGVARPAALTLFAAFVSASCCWRACSMRLGPGHAVRRAASAPRRPAGRRHRRLDSRQAGRILPAFSGRSAPPSPTAARSGRCSASRSSMASFTPPGPGHGKAVISSYMVANDETWRRGMVLSFASAMLQAVVAVVFVAVAAGAAQCHRRTMATRGRGSRS